jgi:hypothetical protein
MRFMSFLSKVHLFRIPVSVSQDLIRSLSSALALALQHHSYDQVDFTYHDMQSRNLRGRILFKECKYNIGYKK